MRALLALLLAVPLAAASAPSRSDPLERALVAHIEVLASDDFEGREPGTEGERLTLRYLAREWFDAGLVSGTNDPGHPWFAPVEVIEREPAGGTIRFLRGNRRFVPAPGGALVVTSGTRSLVEGAPVVFVGQGLAPPSRAELVGRIALMLDSVPAAADAAAASQRTEALLAAGAAAVVTVLDSSRTVEDVASRRNRPGYALGSLPLAADMEAFIAPGEARRLAEWAGLDWEALRREAASPGFKPRVLAFSATVDAATRETRIATHNLIARLPGRRPDLGAVLVLAHWDHFGLCAQPPAEDLVCNGAIDNASGLASLTEIARALARGRPLDRDVYFMATTAEEFGLLGARAFAENPPIPLDRFVAALNLDSTALAPRGTPVGIVGRGMTPLDGEIEKVARRMKREVVAGDGPNAWLKRQDGWALIQHDVPAVMVSSAYGDLARLERFFEDTYHRPGDEAGPDLELGGAAEDVALHVALVRHFADARAYRPK